MSSKVDKSQVVAGAGWLSAVFIVLAKRVHALGGSDEDIHRLATPEGEGLLDDFAKMIVRQARQTFKVTVDYTRTLQEMIEAGSYERVNGDITQENFPLEGKGKQEIEVELFHFNCFISSENAIAEMDKKGFRPATLPELLALSEAYPELQKESSIVALGSCWQDSRGPLEMPILSQSGLGRTLTLVVFRGSWYPSHRFAAVRK